MKLNDDMATGFAVGFATMAFTTVIFMRAFRMGYKLSSDLHAIEDEKKMLLRKVNEQVVEELREKLKKELKEELLNGSKGEKSEEL